METYLNFVRLVSGEYDPVKIPGRISNLGSKDPDLKRLLQYQKTLEDTYAANLLTKEELPYLKEEAGNYMQSRYRSITSADYVELAIEATSDASISAGAGAKVSRASIMEMDIANISLKSIQLNLVSDVPVEYAMAYKLPSAAETPYSGTIPVPLALSEIYMTEYILNHQNVVYDTAALESAVYDYLKPRRLIGTPLTVLMTPLKEIEITANVEFSSLEAAKFAVWDSLEKTVEFLHPITGGEKSTGWDFNRPVTVFELSRLVEKIDGVLRVKSMSILDVSTSTSVDYLEIAGLPLVKKITMIAEGIAYV